jgi:hypothetical protein
LRATPPPAPPPEPAPDRLAARQRLAAFACALAFTLLWHHFLGDVHFKPAEEGYLWYGTERTLAGELPLRDFQSYDPGRYLWAAGWSRLLGDGLTGLRRAGAIFQGLGLFLGLLAARRALRSSWSLAPLALLLGLWMFPRHKVYESALCMTAVWVGVNLLEHPTWRVHLGAGLFVGLAAIFGRNHGLYAALGTLVLLGLSTWKRRDGRWPAHAGAWAAGVVLGYSPMLLAFLFVPGFWASFLDSLRLLLRLGTNIADPWLWPWRLELDGPTPLAAVAALCLGLVYLLPPIVLPLGWWLALRTPLEELPRRALLVAGAVLGTFTIHHAAVRSDPSHLAQALHPTLLALVGLLGLVRGRGRRVALVLPLCLALLFAGLNQHPSLVHVVSAAPLVRTELAGSPVRLLAKHADYYRRLVGTLERLVPPGEELFIAPARPGFYPLLGRRSPSWWIYFFVPDPDRAEQEALVEELRDVEWVLLLDRDIDEREELSFTSSYALVWRHIEQDYQRVPTPRLGADHRLFRRRG